MAVTGQDLSARKSAMADRPGLSALRRLSRRTLGLLAPGWRQVQRLLALTVFSSLARRIIVYNLAGLAVLVLGILFANQWRTGLIEARVQSLRVQGEIIAAAIAASATVDSDVITVNPDRLVELQGDGAISPLSFFDPNLEFPINPERVAPLLRNLVGPSRTRARIYDQQGLLILDSANLYARGEVLQQVTRPQPQPAFFLFDWWNALLDWLPGDDYPQYQEYGADEGTRYPEVAAALGGNASAIVRVDAQHQLVVSVAVPVQRVTARVGVLMLSTQPGDIDQIASAERWGILRIALVAAAVTIILSLLLAGTIAGPLRRLAGAAERVQSTISSRAEIPDFSDRTDEVGHLSKALRSMTSSLYNRIEAIERFAADVAHELKNPLTSLRSAVETLPRAKRAEDRERLNAIIQHDVRRLDRLISDISNASRLDAELARQDSAPVDVGQLAEAMVSIQKDVAQRRNVNVVLHMDTARYPAETVGHDSRLAQVINNLIDNAVSFSPEGGTVAVSVVGRDDAITITVADEGPGIRGDISRIFQRFYTDRPEGEHFGDHSGLGLAISKQIIDAHGGAITARNRTDRSGAEFTVRLKRIPRQAAVTPSVNMHGTGIVLDGVGLMLRGPSGGGKSLLALALLDEWDLRGGLGRLVADDRLDVLVTDAGLVMRAPQAIEGLIELRGRGIVERPYVREAALHVVVDLVDGLVRMLEEDELVTEVLGVPLVRCPVPRAGVADPQHQLLLVREAMRPLLPPPGSRQKTT